MTGGYPKGAKGFCGQSFSVSALAQGRLLENQRVRQSNEE